MRYDHVVVGAGSAGTVLAARLSEDPAREVLLLEAGSDHKPGPDGGPGGASFFDALDTPGRTWDALVARRTPESAPTPYLRGKGIGGSSAVNAMVAIPGLPDDYDRWARLGAEGWEWERVQPWLARTSLSMSLAAVHERGPVSRAVLRARPGAAAAVPLTRDPAGARVSTADCYLTPARSRPNLHVRPDSAVDRVLLDGRTARGVVLTDGTEIEAREVIVSAGAIHSPAILLRSHVDVAGIGEGLKDHPAFPVAIRLSEAAEWDPTALAISVVARGTSGDEPGDLQILPMDHLGPANPRTGLLMVALMSVRSSGSVRLAGSDPHAQPHVDFHLLGDEYDERRLLAGVRQLEQLLQHPALAAVGEPIVPPTDAAGVRANLGEYAHAACTCAMGRVVDSECKVIGYHGLRVCDASVMPDLPRANPHLTIVVVAERVAAMIRGMTA